MCELLNKEGRNASTEEQQYAETVLRNLTSKQKPKFTDESVKRFRRETLHITDKERGLLNGIIWEKRCNV